ncbi:MAG: PAS domain S-box protein [Elainellaceae cyanobacterium]
MDKFQFLKVFNPLFAARLSRKIVLWVFASIVLIEAIILVPSVYRRERELLEYISSLSAAKASGILELLSTQPDGEDILEAVSATQNSSVVLGGTLYRADGTLVGSFGEPPELTYDQVYRQARDDFFDRKEVRYDAVWAMSPLEGQYILIIRHDATWVRDEFFGFIKRIAGLVVIISIFVTTATLIVLDRILITPVMTLRTDLLSAGKELSKDGTCDILPDFESVKVQRQDELGDVNQAFEHMVQQITHANARRKKAEEELRHSEEKFSKAFRCSPNPITLSAMTDGRLVDANASFLGLFGLTSAEASGQTSSSLGLWANLSDRADMVRDLQSHGFVHNREYEFYTRTRQLRSVLYSAERVKIDGQDCLLAVYNDITERKQAEASLRESELRFRTLVEQAADAFFVIDRSAQVVDVNQQACHSLGYSRDELLQLSVSDIQTAVAPEEIQELWTRLEPGQPITLEGGHRRKDGTVFPVEVRIGLFSYNDQHLLLALTRDISERKEAEQVQARLAEIGELASMIVHEVRNPLTTVLMGLMSFKQMDLPPRAIARLDLALDESQRLQRLLNEILLYAREQRLDTQKLELNELFTTLLETLQTMPTVCDRHIQFFSTSNPAWVEGDRDKLKQVFINLISNACEAVQPQDEIRWHLIHNAETCQIEISVHNGGDPIPADVLPRLTQPFFTTKSSGNGLGLAITKRIVEAHQGRLTIESSKDIGTVVTVAFPCAAS